MKVKRFIAIIIALFPLMINAQNYDNLWAEFNKNIENRLPESAVKVLDNIEKQAVKDKNDVQLLKVILSRCDVISENCESPADSIYNYCKSSLSRLSEASQVILNMEMERAGAIGRRNTDGEKNYVNIVETAKKLGNISLKDYIIIFDGKYEKYYSSGNEKMKFDLDFEPTIYDYASHCLLDFYRNNLNKYLDKFNNQYAQLINFDKENNYEKAAIYNEILRVEALVDHYDDKTHNDRYFNRLNELLKESDYDIITARIKSSQASIMMRYENYVEALKLCNEVLAMNLESEDSKKCEECKKNILEKYVAFEMQNVQVPNQPIAVGLTYRNTTTPSYRIYKIHAYDIHRIYNSDLEEVLEFLTPKEIVSERTIEVPTETDYKRHSSLIAIPPLEIGSYVLMMSATDDFDNESNLVFSAFQVSNLTYVTYDLGGKYDIYTLNRETGQPIGKVKVELFEEYYKYKKDKYILKSRGKVTTDNDGYAVLPHSSSYFVINLFKENDTLLADNSYGFYRAEADKNYKRINLYTDRPIYRPGQTVQFKGILTYWNGKKKELVAGQTVSVSLHDANFQNIGQQDIETDEFGAFYGSFELPKDVLNGNFSIQAGAYHSFVGRVNFRVEEYKRPTFEVTFEKPKKEYAINDNVSVTGNVVAFAGFGIDNASYEYTITRRTSFPFRCWWYVIRNVDDEKIASGKGVTDANGLFSIDFKLLPNNNVSKREHPMFEYIINVKATNPQGETHESTFSLYASYNKYNISIDYEKQLISEDGDVLTDDNLKNCKVVVSNISGNPASTKVRCKVYKLAGNERFAKDLGDFDRQILSDEELEKLFPHHDYYANSANKHFDYEEVYNNVINVDGEAYLFKKNAKLTTGNYIIELKSIDDTLSEYSNMFIIHEPTSTKMPLDELCWSAIDKTSVQPDDNVNLYFGSKATDVMAILVISNNENICLTECIKLNNNVKNVSYKVKEEDRGMLNFHVVFVKYNQKQEIEYNVYVPYNNLKLDIEFSTERTKFLPGEKETLSVTIRDYKKNPVYASLMAGMYDASLDAILTNYYGNNKWSFNTLPTFRKVSAFEFDDGFYYYNTNHDTYKYAFYFKENLYSNVRLIFIYPVPTISRDQTSSGATIYGRKYAAVYCEDGVIGNMTQTESDELLEESAEITEENPAQESPAIQIRSNFNETAFFYPNLKTDENGNATFSFTMPDALTRWKLRMLAYSKDLKVGTLEKTFVTQKPVMIMADMPRYCYDEDTLWLVANVVNLSDAEINPTVKLEVFEQNNGTTRFLDCVITPLEMTVEIPAGRSQSVRWKVAMKKDVNLLTFRFSATTDNFCDAEQHTMPVLSTEVFMTQTFSLIAKGNEKKNYNFNFEREGERNHAITLNFSKNPTWYAIQALPYLDKENEKYAESAFYRYFTNSVAKHIAGSVKTSLDTTDYFDGTGYDIFNDTTSISELEKNQDLKEILLQETPWVLDAKNESEQRANIAKLFDSKSLDKNIASALKIIEKKQKPSGGWAWVEGMPESVYVTQYILGGLGRLRGLTGDGRRETEDERVEVVETKAFHFIENDVVKRFSELKEAEKKDYHCSVMIVRELFVMSYFPEFETSAKFKEAKGFYVEKLKKDWTKFNFEAQAGIALIFNRNGNKNEAMAILKSLRECAQKNELGMYWFETAYWSYPSSTRRSIGVEDEARILEAFNEIDPKNEEIDAMRFWILGEKRTSMWDNDRATAEAIYAIVNRGTDWLNDNGEVVLTVNDDTIVCSDRIICDNTHSRSANACVCANVSIDNQTNHQVWGGLFRQYFVPIDKVQKSNEDMKVRRELFVERIEGNKTKYLPIFEEEIKVGDKIKIVLYIENQQNMEFVYLKDLRGSCFEPTEQISRYHYSDGLWYYQSTSDVAMEFFFDNLPKGKHELSHTVYVTKEGSFSAGYAVIQCQYAPEFGAYSEGERIEIK